MPAQNTSIKYCAIFVLLFLTLHSTAQVSCEVSYEALKGSYTGDCKNGKAHGVGKAIGTDSYEGSFKKGYPDGKGLYTYQNGNFFKGEFKKGEKAGNGEMHYLQNGADSTVKGFWKDDKYMGLYEKPYKINLQSPSIRKIAVRELKGGRGQIRLISKPAFKAGFGGIVMPLPVTNISLVYGLYGRDHKESNERVATTILDDVSFPIKMTISFGRNLVEVEFFEEANWELEVETDGEF